MNSPKRASVIPCLKVHATFKHPALATSETGKLGPGINNKGIQVFSTKLSPTDKYVAASFGDGSLRVYNVHEKKRVATIGVDSEFEDHETPVNLVNQSVSTKKVTAADIALPADDLPAYTAVKWRPGAVGADVLLNVDTDGSILLWGGTELRTIDRLHKAEWKSFLTCDWSCDTSRFAAAGVNREIRIFDSTTTANVTTLSSSLNNTNPKVPTGHSNRITCIKYHPTDPNIIFSAGWDRVIHIWDSRKKGGSVARLQCEVSGESLDISKDGKFLATGSSEDSNQIKLFSMVNLSDKKTPTTEPSLLKSFSTPENSPVLTLSFNRTGGLLYGGGGKGTKGCLGFYQMTTDTKAPDQAPLFDLKRSMTEGQSFAGSVWTSDFGHRSEDMIVCGTSAGFVNVMKFDSR